jgi:hypothetical protein
MNIVFLCGCLEAGRDGVGDYTRRLAGEVIRQGHQAAIIAINDHHVNELANKDEIYARENTPELQVSDGTNIPVLRLSKSMTWSNRMQLAKRFVDFHDPDWLSLQFVPYSFHPRGLPFSLARRMNKLGEGRKWQIMFHELWVESNPSSPIRRKLLAFIQKRMIRALIKQLRPKVVNSHANDYLKKLQAFYRTSLQLKLFANIRVLSTVQPKSDSGFFDIVHFGAVRADWNVDAAIDFFNRSGTLLHCNPRLVVIGASSPAAIQTWERFKQRGISVVESGVLDDKTVSSILSMSDAGISGINPTLIEKSGSVAAMLEHGLPVFVVSNHHIAPEIERQIRVDYPRVRFGTDLHNLTTSDFQKYEKDLNTLQRTANRFVQHLIQL